MTPEICVALATALRAVLASPNCDCGIQGCGTNSCAGDRYSAAQKSAQEALKRFDELPKNMAGEYRVFWEIDALDAETPREAAQEAWRAMRRVDSQANVFTVMPPDGMLHIIDLGDGP